MDENEIDPTKWTEKRYENEARKAFKAAGKYYGKPHNHNVHKPKKVKKAYRVPRLMPDGTVKDGTTRMCKDCVFCISTSLGYLCCKYGVKGSKDRTIYSLSCSDFKKLEITKTILDFEYTGWFV